MITLTVFVIFCSSSCLPIRLARLCTICAECSHIICTGKFDPLVELCHYYYPPYLIILLRIWSWTSYCLCNFLTKNTTVFYDCPPGFYFSSHLPWIPRSCSSLEPHMLLLLLKRLKAMGLWTIISFSCS